MWTQSTLLSFTFIFASTLAVHGAPILNYRQTGFKAVSTHLFRWNWESVAKECTEFLGPAGYGFVQVSPPQEHVQGEQWFTDYQPVSYSLTSKRGNREQFAKMIETCHAAGVSVIVDAVINHMSGVESGTGIGGSPFTHYDYPGTYQTQDFHHCGVGPNDDISNFGDRYQVQFCELVNLADLATDTEYVRARIAEYLNDLLSLGVDGFRIDAAKHMPAGDLSNIIGRLSHATYITQEMIFGGGEPITPEEYAPNGDVQEFRYTFTLKDAFLNSGIANLRDLESRGFIFGLSANPFVANHDTERNDSSLSAKNGAEYTLALVFSLAHPYGKPTVLSSYEFTDKDAGAPNNGVGTCSDNGGTNGWVCEHRWKQVAGMVGFRNTVAESPLTNWVSGSNQQIAFGRGSAGFVAINNDASEWSTTFTTGLPDGVYCDVASGTITGSGCTGTEYKVSGGTFSPTISAKTAIALHIGATSK